MNNFRISRNINKKTMPAKAAITTSTTVMAATITKIATTAMTTLSNWRRQEQRRPLID